MSPKERVTLLRRGFALGYRAALRLARKDLCTIAANFDAEIARLENQFSAAATVAAATEFRRDKINRAIEAAVAERRAIQQATDERALIPDGWLH